ncbi:hypothetical protein RB195_016297 [Necator americanus]|uniref:Sorbitol dehydrogenase n=1 Tax=Necator americanus TaxID=51031 RepID=A0ABR1E933_NECAM
MSDDNLTAVLYGVNDIRLEQREIPKPGPDQLLISIHTVGVCGSDVHFYSRGAIGSFVVKEPLVLGHECSGTVVELGSEVKNFIVGDRVALEPGVPCLKCDQCKIGRYNLCPDVIFFATPPTDGSLTRFIVHSANFCFKLPENVSYEEGALLEPLTVAVFASRRAQLQMGQRVLVHGAGPIGVLCMMTAKALGVTEVVITDLSEERLELARKLGADHVLCVKGMSVNEIRSTVIQFLGCEPEVTMECTGAQSCVESAILTTRSGGVVVMVGLGPARMEIPLIDAALREVDLRGVFRYANSYPTALKLVASGRINLSGLTRAYYKLEDVVEAFERSIKGDVMKHNFPKEDFFFHTAFSSLKISNLASRKIMSEDNLSAVLYGIDDIRLEQREIPKPAENQLLISVNTVGICGSDVHYWTHGAIGSFVVKEPMVLGHETCGTVVGVGPSVKGFTAGDRVALEPGIPCRGCEHCKTGRYNLCAEMRFFATPPVHGSLARYVVHDADFCYKLPDNVTFEEGALLEPLSVAVHACRRAHLQMGQRILVQGAGPIGTLCMMTARAMGAAEVLITDLDEGRLALAKKLGAEHTLCVKGMSVEQIRGEIIKSLGVEPEVTIECTGAQSCMESSILTTRSGGVIVTIGLGAPRADLPIIDSAIREVDIRGVFRYANCYPTALNLVASGRIDLSGLTRAHYKLEETMEAFKRAQKADVIKVFISCQK